MVLRIDTPSSPKTNILLRHCYLFVSLDWQHLPRDESPDQGFETRFRNACVEKLASWVVSQHREMGLGLGLTTASGISHEIDLVTQGDPVVGVLELKNRKAWVPEKNDVIVFFAKILDYLCFTPSLLRMRVVPVFISCYGFEQSGLAACLGIGIHPVAPFLRPLPLLIDNARYFLAERAKGTDLSPENNDILDEYCSHISRMDAVLADAALNNRFRRLNDTTLEVAAIRCPDPYDLADELRRLNGVSDHLIAAFRQGKPK